MDDDDRIDEEMEDLSDSEDTFEPNLPHPYPEFEGLPPVGGGEGMPLSLPPPQQHQPQPAELPPEQFADYGGNQQEQYGQMEPAPQMAQEPLEEPEREDHDENQPDEYRGRRAFHPMDYVPASRPDTVYCQPIKWRRIVSTDGPIPRPRHGHRAVIVQDNFIIWGGGNEGIIDEPSLYNISTNRWTIPVTRGDIPTGSAAGGLVKGYGPYLYMFGGMVEYGQYSNDLYELDLIRWEWKKMRPRTKTPQGPVPCPRLGHTFVADKNGTLYVFGGLTNSSGDLRHNKPVYLGDFFMVNVNGAAQGNVYWEQPKIAGPAPEARESHSAVLYEKDDRKEMIIYGGMNGNRLGDVWSLDLIKMQWQQKYCGGVEPLPRSLHTANILGEKMFVFGGWVPLAQDQAEQDHKWKCTSSVGVLNLTNWTWEHPGTDFSEPYSEGVETFPRSRSGHCSAATANRIYVWSGRDGYRKAWNNQVCCRDFWFLETEKPLKPSRIFLGKATTTSLELSWVAVKNAEAYLIQLAKNFDNGLQFGKTTPGSSKPLLQLVKSPTSGQVVHVMKQTTPGGQTKTVLVRRPEPVDSRRGDEMPENFMEEPPGAPGQGAQAAELPPKLPPPPPAEPQEDDDDWCDVAIVRGTNHVISKYFIPSDAPRMGDDYRRDFDFDQWVAQQRQAMPLGQGTSYKVRIAGLNLLGRGEFGAPVMFKTSLPGFPGAPSNIKIQKTPDGAHVSWEGPQLTNGNIAEYSVYLAVKMADGERRSMGMQFSAGGKPLKDVEFLRVYCGPVNECYVDTKSLIDAHVESASRNKPAIIFRIAAKNEKGYGPATQVRWLQDLRELHPANPQQPQQPGTSRDPDNIPYLQAAVLPSRPPYPRHVVRPAAGTTTTATPHAVSIVRGQQIIRQAGAAGPQGGGGVVRAPPAMVYRAAQPTNAVRYQPYAAGHAGPSGVQRVAAVPPHRQLAQRAALQQQLQQPPPPQ